MRTTRLLVPFLAVLAAAASAGCRAPGRVRPVALSSTHGVLQDRPGAVEAAVDRARVVCVGESHDQRSHHEFQLDVLRRMASRGGPLLLGMEMFQRPAQTHLDAYVTGKIDELEMLRRTEYYTRWGSDHTLYAPLWRFCRENGIRVVGLNVKGEVQRKLSREGIDALTPEERAQIAGELDFAVASHRERNMSIFDQPAGAGFHGAMDPSRVERMYRAMTVWDETMAESAVNALEEAGPSSRMLVVAGIGHFVGYDGIPDRITRRMPRVRPVVIACTGETGDVFAGGDPWSAAHFVVRLPDSAGDEAPKLGVTLREGSGVVETVAPGSHAERLGVKPGDEMDLASTDGRLVPVRDLTTLRYVLHEFWRKGGEGGLIVIRRGGTVQAAKRFDLVPQPDSAHS